METPASQAELSAVSETLFLPLYALALESRADRPILADEDAVRITEALNATFAGSARPIHRKLARGQLPRTFVTTVTLRIRHFDQVTEAFLRRHPCATVVSLGSGLSGRRGRVDDGQMRWYDLDLPAVSALRRRFFPETPRSHSISSSVLDPSWMDEIPAQPGQPILFLAEGLLMYLEEADVRALVVRLRERFPGAELLAEVSNRRVAEMSAGTFGRGKLRRQFGLSEDVWFRSGLSHPKEMEGWAEGITSLGDWGYFDEDEPRLGWMRLFARWELVGRAQYVVHYRLG